MNYKFTILQKISNSYKIFNNITNLRVTTAFRIYEYNDGLFFLCTANKEIKCNVKKNSNPGM